MRLRTKVTKGAGSREAGMAMAFKLLDAAQARWRRINGHELVPLPGQFLDRAREGRLEVDQLRPRRVTTMRTMPSYSERTSASHSTRCSGVIW